MKIQQCYEILLNHVDEKNNEPIDEISLYDYFLSFFHVDNLEKIIQWLKDYHSNHVIQLHVSWNQVMGKEIYVHDNHYIPLWHCYIEYKSDNYNQMFYVFVTDMPQHIKRLENNDLIVYLDKKTSDYKIGQSVHVSITASITFDFNMTSIIMHQKYHILLRKGLPRINHENKYDISNISNIIIVFLPSK